jgi:hypothetical protein
MLCEGLTHRPFPPGNLGQLFNSKGLPFHEELVERYGGMVKIRGFFGVHFFALKKIFVDKIHPYGQDEQLYVSDPTALQSIIGKDQDAFEETAVFIEYVLWFCVKGSSSS